MKRNKKGNVFLGVIIAFLVWSSGVLFLPYIEDLITSSRSSLSCSLTTITSGAMLQCLTLDAIVPYFILFIISVAVGYLVAKQ